MTMTALSAQAIDRAALVTRHNPVLRQLNPASPLSVGNGEFAFTADITGLQTFPELYEQHVPLGTFSQWGWHSFPNPKGYSIDTYEFTPFDSHGRPVEYADVASHANMPHAADWLRSNPHRLHLGRIGLQMTTAAGAPVRPADLTTIEQTLDLFSGLLTSRFKLDGQAVEVQTVCHPTSDLIAARIQSPLLSTGQVKVIMEFPYGSVGMTGADWGHPNLHHTELTIPAPDRAGFARRLDDDTYHAAAVWSPGAVLAAVAPHRFLLTPAPGAATMELTCAFAPRPITAAIPAFEPAKVAAHDHWNRFWTTGGAIDLSGSTDSRAAELERRIVLSQYLTAIQCAGRYPPQETGLTFNSWHGKFHLEMHWWHAAHFALWNRIELLEKSLPYYQVILPRAQAMANGQGYTGARWPKMTDPAGRESPSGVGPFLIWQQPHPIYYAELCYRAHGDRATLEKYREIVFESAEFMASYATWDEAAGRYVLGPPLHLAQEIYPKAETFNGTYELVYWRWGLETAQQWRERIGLPRHEKWDEVLRHLSRPIVQDGKYLFAESAPATYTDKRYTRDHPSVLAALGVLPGPGVDLETMRATLHWIMSHWTWEITWGWDYPMVAMTAARLGEPGIAVDALLMDVPKNTYRLNGHNAQGSRASLPIYLPGNGGLLMAVAMMANGWDGSPPVHAPGFPPDGKWIVRHEGLRLMP